MPIIKACAIISNMRLQKKAVEATATNNYAETTSTEVKLRLNPAVFLSTTLKRRYIVGTFFLFATVYPTLQL